MKKRFECRSFGCPNFYDADPNQLRTDGMTEEEWFDSMGGLCRDHRNPPAPEPVAVARHGDPDTSWDAAASVRDIRASQDAVYRFLLSFGPAIDAVWIPAYVAKMGLDYPIQSESGLRTRRSELEAMGKVKFTGRKFPTPRSNRQAREWQAI